jgi:hypothetical protein
MSMSGNSTGAAASPCAPFTPASPYIIPSGANTKIRDWIVLGVLNGLAVALGHVIYSLYFCLGPLALVMQFFHQSVNNLLIASVYLLMAFIAPFRRPFTLNAVVWGMMGLMEGWWTIFPVAVPAGLLADAVIRRAVPGRRLGWVLVSFAFYTTMLDAGIFWPYLFLKHSAMVQRMMAMDPGSAAMVDMFTLPFFAAILGACCITGFVGGFMALKLINRHFALETTAP